VVAGRLATTKRSVLLLGPRQVGNRRSAAASAPRTTSTSRTRPLSLGASGLGAPLNERTRAVPPRAQQEIRRERRRRPWRYVQGWLARRM